MKKLYLSGIATAFLLFSLTSTAQEQKRSYTPGMERFSQLILNYQPSQQQHNGVRENGVVLLSENFDATGGALPAGWTTENYSESGSCMWGVDDSPNPPAYFSPGFSLNFNNGVDYNCGLSYGSVTTPLIDVSGMPLNISFRFFISNECGGTPCMDIGNYYDDIWIGIFDQNDTELFWEIIPGTTAWNLVNYSFPNSENAQMVYIVFYFNSGDSLFNEYAGPFIDDLVISGTPPTPLSGWAVGIGLALILGFTVLRLRKIN